jgi:hypothetical protein
MGRDRHEKHKQGALPPFVPVLIATLDTTAWRAMSHGARSLYVALKRRFNKNSPNNGRLYLSQRTAAKELGSHHNEIARWFRELQHFGFIVMTSPGSLGVEGKGKAPHWRLTELGYLGAFPTRDYDHWDGTKFTDRKTKSRAPIPARGVRENQHGSVLENHPSANGSVLEIQHIHGNQGVRENQHITSLPLTSSSSPSSSCLSASPFLVAALERKDARAKRAPQGAVASERVPSNRSEQNFPAIRARDGRR